MTTRRFACASLLGLMVVAVGCTAPDRGSWWYRHPSAGDPYGIEEVFAGTGALTTTDVADAALDCGVRRIYGSYGPMTGSNVPSASQVAAFNVELHSRDMTSEFLLSDSSYLTNPSLLYQHVTERVLDFNDAHVGAGERFDAVRLDIEPVSFPACKLATLDPVACYELVAEWLLVVSPVRDLLSSAEPPVALHVDIHEWLDVTTGGRIAWPTDPTADASRDDWFVTLDAYAQGVTVMAYDHVAAADVWNATSYEATHLGHEVRAGINLDAATSFPDVPSLLAGATLVESSYGLDTDLHDLNDVLAAGGC